MEGGSAVLVAPLEGAALKQAASSVELFALRAAVTAKDAAVTLAWGGRSGGGVSGGWGSAFAIAPPTSWKEAVTIGREGGAVEAETGRVLLKQQWEAWRASVSSLVEGMEGVLAGVVAAAPSLRSSLEHHLEMRSVPSRFGTILQFYTSAPLLFFCLALVGFLVLFLCMLCLFAAWFLLALHSLGTLWSVPL